MMKNILGAVLLTGIIGLTTQCNNQSKQKKSSTHEAVADTEKHDRQADSSLYATLQCITDAPNLQDSLMIRFTVINPTKDTLKFTAYHTPFEGLISKFLTVTDSAGNEVSYQGPMAKRVMPPPAETYHAVAPGKNESVTFDLKKCYKIEYPGTYTLQYNAEKISGIANGKPITIKIAK